MIFLLNSSNDICEMMLVSDNHRYHKKWVAKRTLATNLLREIEYFLKQHQFVWNDISALGVYKGPGSYTGLRIGITVINTLADSLVIPVVGVTGEDWQNKAVHRLRGGENDAVIVPEYGGEPHTTRPVK
jgi:tRNA threonylcarbamoyladenosine biosynthesis protein TsaB